jgi:predicted RNA-binding Zn-ribbon protein involved in translation (DUF1610 family)
MICLTLQINENNNMSNEPHCPECGEPTLATRESRKTREATRRRRICSVCGFRHTTYEVSQTWYREAQRNRDIVSKLQEVMGAGLQTKLKKTKTSRASCLMCTFMTDRGCSFGFPEAGDEFATECSQYVPAKDG